MKMNRLALVFVFLIPPVQVQAGEELVTVHGRRDIDQYFLLIRSDGAAAAVILFAGGKGALYLSSGASGPTIGRTKNNFLVRARAIGSPDGA